MHYQDSETMSSSLWTDIPIWLGENSLQMFEVLPIYLPSYPTGILTDPISYPFAHHQQQANDDAMSMMACYQDPTTVAMAPPSQPPSSLDPMMVPVTQSLMSSQSTPLTSINAPAAPLVTRQQRKRTKSMPSFMTEEECTPRPQNPRYKDDEYSPRWVRYSGHLKEGYCDTCPEGRWLQLKNSAYWYHKQFCHGISSVTGRPFADPVQQQRVGPDGALQGLCHQCGCFVPICNGKRRRNNLLWYKHAHKCHVYSKPEKFNAPF